MVRKTAEPVDTNTHRTFLLVFRTLKCFTSLEWLRFLNLMLNERRGLDLYGQRGDAHSGRTSSHNPLNSHFKVQ